MARVIEVLHYGVEYEKKSSQDMRDMSGLFDRE